MANVDRSVDAARSEPEALSQFRKDIAEHVITVLLDQGNYRHLRFSKPGTNCYHFNIVTWPGYLAISGDMGASVFSRMPDMFEFFREPTHIHNGAHGLYINRGYWCEKLVANDGTPREYDADLLMPLLRDKFDSYLAGKDLDTIENGTQLAKDLWEQIQEDVYGDTVEEVITAADKFEPHAWSDHGEVFGDFRFTDMWEYGSSLEDYTFHMVWRLYAVSYAVRMYDAWKDAKAASAAEEGACNA